MKVGRRELSTESLCVVNRRYESVRTTRPCSLPNVQVSVEITRAGVRAVSTAGAGLGGAVGLPEVRLLCCLGFWAHPARRRPQKTAARARQAPRATRAIRAGVPANRETGCKVMCSLAP